MKQFEQTGAELNLKGLQQFLGGFNQLNRAMASNMRVVGQLAKEYSADGKAITKNRLEMVNSVKDSVAEMAQTLLELDMARAREIEGLAENVRAYEQYVKTLDEIDEKNRKAAGAITLFGGAKGRELGLVIQNNQALAVASLAFNLFGAGVRLATGLVGGFVNALMRLGNVALRAVQSGLSVVSSLLKTLLSPLTNAIEGFRQFWNRVAAVASGVLLRDVIFGLLRAFKEFSSEVFTTAAMLQTVEIRLENLLAAQARAADSALSYAQSNDIAARSAQGLLKWITDLALQVPIQFKDIADMTAYGMAMGFTDEQAKSLTVSIGNYTAGMGLASDVTERILFNFGQMRAAGKVTATEMRDLARGAFFPLTEVLDEAARMLGIAGDNLLEFRRQAAEGEIDVNTFFQAFENVVARRFPDAMERFGKTIDGARIRLKNFFDVIIGGDVLGPVVGRIGRLLSEIADRLASDDIRQGAQLIGQVLARSFSTVTTAIRYGLLPALGELGKAFGITGSFAENLSFAIAFIAVGLRKTIYAISEILRNIAENFDISLGGVADRALEWGVNIMAALSSGLAAGLRFVVNIMVMLSNLLANWLAPGSPPKVAPLIDRWGAEAMTEYLRGFLDADFTLFDTLSDKLESFFRSLPGAWGKDQLELIPAILAMRESVARAIGAGGDIAGRILGDLDAAPKEFRAFIQALAGVDAATRRLAAADRELAAAQELADAAGERVAAAQAQVEAVQKRVRAAQDEAAAATDRLRAAQERVNAIQERYGAILDELNKQLHDLTQGYEDQTRLAKIQEAIGTGLLTDEERLRLETEKRAIELRAQIRAVEEQRDTEVAAAEKIVKAHEAEVAAAEARVAAL
jgi:tape measure domain-containing protein